jgi:hypothetical protein
MRSIQQTLVVTLAICVLACGGNPVPGTPTPVTAIPQFGTVAGIVREQVPPMGRIPGGAILAAGVTVTVIEGGATGTTTSTDSGGHYSLTIPAGPIRLRWTKATFQPRESATAWIAEPGRTTSIFDLLLLPFGTPGAGQLIAPPPPVVSSAPLHVEATAGILQGGGGVQCVGQSVTIPGSGFFNNIKFSWYSAPSSLPHPSAWGGLYILIQPYDGVPCGMNAATPGVVAHSSSTDPDEYVFDSDVKLRGGVKYWFYTDSPLPFVLYDIVTDEYPEGDMYLAIRNSAYARLPLTGAWVGYADANFKLTGTAVDSKIGQ